MLTRTEVLMTLRGIKLINWKLARYFGINFRTMLLLTDDLANRIKKMESGKSNIYQIGGGPGSGFYQVENSRGSGTNETWLRRTVNTLGKECPAWVRQMMGKDVNFITLSEFQQDLLFLGNMWQEKGSFESLRKIIEAKPEEVPEACFEYWRDHHKKAPVTPQEKERFLAL